MAKKAPHFFHPCVRIHRRDALQTAVPPLAAPRRGCGGKGATLAMA